uniref:NACHT LRR and PYD domain-containing protein n=1 Tax=Oryzias latipes TaxID=8090 RepID=A0A3P9LH55_ORYLA
MQDLAVCQEIQELWKPRNRSKKKLLEIHCSALTLCLVSSCPVCSLQKCGLSEVSCAALVPALKSNPSHLKHLNLCSNSLEDSGVKHLCTLLESPHCRLRTLGLMNCSLSEVNCKVLASALMSNPFHLTELDLAQNELQDSGVLRLCGFLESPDCRLKALGLKICSLSEVSCEALASALKSNPSYLTDLELDGNELRDSGALHLCGFLKSPDCRLKALGSVIHLLMLKLHSNKQHCRCLGFNWKPVILTTLMCGRPYDSENNHRHTKSKDLISFFHIYVNSFSDQQLSANHCEVVASALKSSSFHLVELDLSLTNLQYSAAKALCSGLESPNCKLETLRLVNCSLSKISCEALISALKFNPSHLTELDLSRNELQDSGVFHLCGFLKSPHCRLKTLRSILYYFSRSSVRGWIVLKALEKSKKSILTAQPPVSR